MNLIPDAPQGTPDADPSPSPVLEIRTGTDQGSHDESAEPWTLVTVRGEIDMDNAGEFVDTMMRIAGAAVVDLSEVTFIDSTGVHGLMRAQQAARQRGYDLILRHPSTAVRRVLELAGLIDTFKIER